MTTIAYLGNWPAQKKYKDSHKEFLKLRRNAKQEWEATNKRRSTAEGWAKERFPKLKHKAKKFGYEFSILWKDIVPPEFCPVFGTRLVLIPSGKAMANPNAPSVDRFDNNLGYTKENIRVISNRANLLKRDATKLEIGLLLKYMEGR